jgi:DNA-binding NarL/FixJ family response regulator
VRADATAGVAPGQSEKRAASGIRMDNTRIYIVEDSSIIRENLIEALKENAPVEVVGTADDEKSAVAWLRDSSHASDLVIVDIFLKSGSGLGVLKAMGEMPNAPERIVLSNHATPEIRIKCKQLGAIKVFDKSNELDEMLGWLNRFAQSDRGAAASSS